ncbi:MAG: HIT family protein [Prevotellaceae bacterium]|jgi:histidine triad (HIT) family protein|nr:HIT family protein [Prevotellaceae bacterium]
MASIFTKIVNGEIPSYSIAEDDRFFAFLDINPVSKGHCLVIPKQETDYLFDLDPALLGDLIKFAQKIAKALKQAIDCKRVGVAVMGLEVPHAHIHLVPMNSEADIDFRKPKIKLTPDEFKALTQKIKQYVTL